MRANEDVTRFCVCEFRKALFSCDNIGREGREEERKRGRGCTNELNGKFGFVRDGIATRLLTSFAREVQTGAEAFTANLQKAKT